MANVSFGIADPGHDQTCSGGDNQSRNLCHQTVANREQRVILCGLPQFHVVLCNADDEAAEDIDDQDENARYGIATHEL